MLQSNPKTVAKKRKKAPPAEKPQRRSAPFNNPFAAVGQDLKRSAKRSLKSQRASRAERAVEQTASPPMTASPAAKTEDDLFLEAMSGAARIDPDQRGQIRPRVPRTVEQIPVYDEEAEVLAQLASLVEGSGRFDISDSDEFIEASVEGLDRRIMRRLRKGDYAVSRHLDLHGMTRQPAREAVEEFIAECVRRRERCVLIVHGRGLNSKDNIPVLKGLVAGWLERGRIGRKVLAFSTAQPHDGGAGAMYVLLRRS